MTEVAEARRWPSLKVVEAEAWSRVTARRRAERLGYSVALQRIERPGPFLRFSLYRRERAMRCLIDVHQWVAMHMPALEGWAWSVCDATSAAMFFGHAPDPLMLLDADTDYDRAVFEGLVTAEALGSTVDMWPTLQAREGVLWLEHLDWAVDTGRVPLPEDLSLRARLSVGTVALRRRQISAVGAGDVIVLGKVEALATVGCARLFSFQIDTREMVVVNDIFDGFEEPAPEREDQTALPTRAGTLNLAGLPLTLEVVLCELKYTVAQLAEIREGGSITLPEHAHRGVKLYLQGTCIGSGELVQVGQGLGVQLDGALSVS